MANDAPRANGSSTPNWSWWKQWCARHYPELRSDEQLFQKLLVEYAATVGN